MQNPTTLVSLGSQSLFFDLQIIFSCFANTILCIIVVITDLLAAGFEIENPRINDLPGTSWVKDNAYPDHSDIRDDRINLFVSASPNVQNYYYVVRCVTKGNFKMGPVGADAMYNGEFHSYYGGGMIKIIGK